VLVDAVNVLVNESGFCDFRVSIVGGPANPEDFQYLERLKEKAQRCGVECHLNWVGAVAYREIVLFLQRAHALVRTQGGGWFSKHELEALASGLPAIVCAPVYRQVYGPFQSSLCFRAKDPLDLADKIRATASWTSEQRGEFTHWARSYVERHHNLMEQHRQRRKDQKFAAGFAGSGTSNRSSSAR